MKKRKILSLLVTCTMLVTCLFVPPVSYGAAFSDTGGHWAASYIDQAVEKGFVNGYPDGTFRPDKAVTRAEFTSMVNKALKNSATSNINFTDVPYGEWFYAEISKAVAATYVAGYENGTFLPNSPITRQEAAVVISRIIPTYGSTGNLSAYPDSGSVADWAATAFQKVNGKGYIGAYNDGNLHPLDQLTRAQTAKIICDILNKENIITSDPVVKSGTTLSNAVYTNGLTIHKDAGENNVTIDNCVVLGNLTIQGGGTVTVSNSRVAQSAVEKSAPVKVVVRGESVVASLTAARAATIQSTNLTGGLYGSGIGHLTTLSSSDITLQGSFSKVTVGGSSAKLTLSSGSIANLIVSSGASKSDITIDSGASVGTADVNAESYFHGTGIISRMNVNANNVTYETKPTSVTTGSQYSAPSEGETEMLTFSPKSGATKVSRSTDITITCWTAMKLYDGGTLTDDDIEDIVTLREGSSGGDDVPYTASINSAKTVITLAPDDYLEEDTKYYVSISKNSIEDKHGDGNKAYTISFTTGDSTDSSDITFSPKSGATGVSLSIEPKITFPEAIETYGGKTVTDGYLDDDVIVFKENSSNGAEVSFTATIDTKKKVITISPDSELKAGQKYYLGIASKELRYKSDASSITSKSVTWTTADAKNAAQLSNLTVDGASLNKSFDKAAYSYTATTPAGGTSVTLNATGASNVTVKYRVDSGSYVSGSSVTVTGTSAGSKKVEFQTSRTGYETQTYTITVNFTAGTQSPSAIVI